MLQEAVVSSTSIAKVELIDQKRNMFKIVDVSNDALISACNLIEKFFKEK